MPVPRWRSRRSREQDLDREIQAHLDLEAEEYATPGTEASAARHAARRAFGNVALVKEDVRAVWSSRAREALLQEARCSAC
jgi:putative ABC transport system permease protein